MKAARFERHGGPEVVRIESIETPRPGQGQVLVQVRAAGLNNLDLWVRRGLPIETTMPHIGGSDIAGTVAELGHGVERWEVGDDVVINPALSCGKCTHCLRDSQPLCDQFRILGEHTNGGFAEFLLVDAAQLHRLPAALSHQQAACLPISYQTAWRALFSRARLTSSEDVLVIGASGGTAIAAIQIARLIGARVFALTSGSANVQRVRELGATFVYDRLENPDWSRSLKADTDGKGVEVVVENVGLPTWDSSIHCLASGGRLITYGATAGPKVQLDIRRVFWKQIEIMGTTMASHPEFAAMLNAASAGHLVPVIDRTLPLESAAEAHAYLESGKAFGKVILEP